MDIKTKFNLGDQVWSGEGYWQNKYKQCPDCLGKKQFDVTTPAGEKFATSCPTCSEGWQSTGRVREYGFSPLINHLTIGQVRVEIRDGEVGQAEEYMCHQTGVGSGRCWKVMYLFHTMEEALEFAQAECERKALEKEIEEEKKRKNSKKEMRAYK